MKLFIVFATLFATALCAEDCTSEFSKFETCKATAKTHCESTTTCPTGTAATHAAFAGESHSTPSPAEKAKWEAMHTCLETKCPRPTGAGPTHAPEVEEEEHKEVCEAKAICMCNQMKICFSGVSTACKASREAERVAVRKSQCTCHEAHAAACATTAGITLPTHKPFNCSEEHEGFEGLFEHRRFRRNLPNIESINCADIGKVVSTFEGAIHKNAKFNLTAAKDKVEAEAASAGESVKTYLDGKVAAFEAAHTGAPGHVDGKVAAFEAAHTGTPHFTPRGKRAAGHDGERGEHHYTGTWHYTGPTRVPHKSE